MAPSTAVEKAQQIDSQLELSPDEAALVAAATADIDPASLTVPLLKIAQALSGEVSAGTAKPGDFVNALTSETFGREIQFVVSAFEKGRFLRSEEGRGYATTGKVAPASWPEEYAGRVFTELDDAEERYSARANAGEIEWGRGPKISTTYNFIGYVIGSEVPVRLSLMRTNTRAAEQLQTLIKLSRAPWDKTFVLRTEERETRNKAKFFTVTVEQNGATDAEQRSRSVELARSFASGLVEEAAPEDDAPAKPKAAKGGVSY